MNPRLRYLAMVHGVGAAALRWQRLQAARRLARAARRERPHQGPPLRSGARLKELIARHYLAARYAPGARPVAWVTSGAPSEFLVALGYHLHYPENHGAMCGIRRVADADSEVAEQAGFSVDLCSYARTDFGAIRGGPSPAGGVPRPDLLVCCTNICQTVLYWYQEVAAHYEVPLVVIDTPFLYRESGPTEHDLTFVERQIEEAIAVAERVARRDLRPAALERTVARARDAVDLWMRVLESTRARPAPMTVFDAFIHLAPIVEMRGTPEAVDHYAALLAELEARARAGIAAVKGERLRLLWDNLPVWPRVRWLSELLARHGAALVASTYTQAWGELRDWIDPAHPLRSAAQTYLRPILNRGTGQKLAAMAAMARDWQADGAILHSDRSCKPYSIGQVDQARLLAREHGVPALLLEADHNDTRAFSEEQATTRIEAFLESLESRA